ncbi:TPA: RNA-dependent DNA polymerase, partial [Escherichia coli]
MSLHDKLLMHNFALANKKSPDFISELPQIEPKPYSNGHKIKWINHTLTSTEVTPPDNLIKICILIESGEIAITSVSDIANLLGVPAGQLLYILYRKKDNYRTFEIEKKNGKKRVINAPCGGL